MNFSTIQRIDDRIAELLMMVHKVMVYEYLETSKTWERSSVEGTLFIYSRLALPRFALLVLNQLSSDNLLIYINEEVLIHTQNSFVLIRDFCQDVVYGLNFYDEHRCQNVGSLLQSFLDYKHQVGVTKKTMDLFTDKKCASGFEYDMISPVVPENNNNKLLESFPTSWNVKSPVTSLCHDIEMSATSNTCTSDAGKALLLQPSAFVSSIQVEQRPCYGITSTCTFPSIPLVVHSPGMKALPCPSYTLSKYHYVEKNSYSLGTNSEQPTNVMSSPLQSFSVSQYGNIEEFSGIELTRSQMQQALIHLIKSDEGFIDRLHSAYLESLDKR